VRHWSNSWGPFLAGVDALAPFGKLPAEPASAAPVILAHMVGAAVLCIITLALLLTLKR
jgi:hypothetical protein